MGLAYPAGPEMDRLAEQGNPKAFDFPRPLLHDASDDFSFSGLKTSVRYFLPRPTRRCWMIRKKSATSAPACRRPSSKCSSTKPSAPPNEKASGASPRPAASPATAPCGSELALACKKNGFTLRLAEKTLCTDNAAMIGILAERKLAQKIPATGLDEDIKPGWVLA